MFDPTNLKLNEFSESEDESTKMIGGSTAMVSSILCPSMFIRLY